MLNLRGMGRCCAVSVLRNFWRGVVWYGEGDYSRKTQVQRAMPVEPRPRKAARPPGCSELELH
jgi:hypothetical protein